MSLFTYGMKATILSWRIYNMSKQTMNIAKTVGIGLIAGTAAVAVTSAVMSTNNSTPKKMKKTAGKAMHSMGQIVNSMESMLK